MIPIASERNRICLGRRRLFVGYLLAGYPGKDSFFEILSNCEAAGLDIFEIGFPSKNPAGDGAIIKKAHGLTDLSLQKDLPYWQRIRNTVSNPVWVMGYEQDLIDSGFYKLLAQNGLADALVIPDISFDKRLSLQEELQPMGVDVLGFITPDMAPEEQQACFTKFSLIYQQLYSGPTGMAVEAKGFEEILSRAKQHQGLHVFAGFGIASSERAEELLDSGFDGVVIGTAMVSRLNRSKEDLTAFVKDLHETVRKRR